MSEAKLDEIIVLLKELLMWSKFAGKQQLKGMLNGNLKKDAEKLVYEFSDGEHNSRDIGEVIGVGKTSVAKYWEKWFTLGIVEESKKFNGRMQHICSLGEVGLELPRLMEPSATEQETPATKGGEST